MENPLLTVLESLVAFVEHSNGPRKFGRAAREALEELSRCYRGVPMFTVSPEPESPLVSLEESAIISNAESDLTVPETQTPENE